jgi:hypothetical protein
MTDYCKEIKPSEMLMVTPGGGYPASMVAELWGPQGRLNDPQCESNYVGSSSDASRFYGTIKSQNESGPVLPQLSIEGGSAADSPRHDRHEPRQESGKPLPEPRREHRREHRLIERLDPPFEQSPYPRPEERPRISRDSSESYSPGRNLSPREGRPYPADAISRSSLAPEPTPLHDVLVVPDIRTLLEYNPKVFKDIPYYLLDETEKTQVGVNSATFDIKAMQEQYDSLFSKFDRNQKGYLSEDDINDALNLKSETLSKSDRDALTLLRNNSWRETISELNDDEIGFENNGVYPEDLKKFVGAFEQQNEWENVRDFFYANSTALIGDQGWRGLTEGNATSILRTGTINGEPLTEKGRRALEYVLKNWDEIATLWDDDETAISPYDFNRFNPNHAL